MINNIALRTTLKNKVVYSLFISLLFILSCNDNNTDSVVENPNIVVHGIQIKDENQKVILRYFQNKYDNKYSNEIKVLEERSDEFFKIDLLDKNGKVIDTIPKNNFIFDLRLSDNKNFKILKKYNDILSFKIENTINTEVKLSIFISCNNIQNTKIENLNISFADFNEEKLTIVKEYSIYDDFWGTYHYKDYNDGIGGWRLKLVDSIKTFAISIVDANNKYFQLNSKIHKIEVSQTNKKYFVIIDRSWGDPLITFTLQGLLKNESFTVSVLNLKIFQLFKGEYIEILNSQIGMEIY